MIIQSNRRPLSILITLGWNPSPICVGCSSGSRTPRRSRTSGHCYRSAHLPYRSNEAMTWSIARLRWQWIETSYEDADRRVPASPTSMEPTLSRSIVYVLEKASCDSTPLHTPMRQRFVPWQDVLLTSEPHKSGLKRAVHRTESGSPARILGLR